MLGFVGVVAIPSPRPHSTATVWDRVNSLSIIDFSLLGPRGTRLGKRGTTPAPSGELQPDNGVPFKLAGFSPRCNY